MSCLCGPLFRKNVNLYPMRCILWQVVLFSGERGLYAKIHLSLHVIMTGYAIQDNCLPAKVHLPEQESIRYIKR